MSYAARIVRSETRPPWAEERTMPEFSETIMASVTAKDPNQPEFLQAFPVSLSLRSEKG